MKIVKVISDRNLGYCEGQFAVMLTEEETKEFISGKDDEQHNLDYISEINEIDEIKGSVTFGYIMTTMKDGRINLSYCDEDEVEIID